MPHDADKVGGKDTVDSDLGQSHAELLPDLEQARTETSGDATLVLADKASSALETKDAGIIAAVKSSYKPPEKIGYGWDAIPTWDEVERAITTPKGLEALRALATPEIYGVENGMVLIADGVDEVLESTRGQSFSIAKADCQKAGLEVMTTLEHKRFLFFRRNSGRLADMQFYTWVRIPDPTDYNGPPLYQGAVVTEGLQKGMAAEARVFNQSANGGHPKIGLRHGKKIPLQKS